MGFRQTWDKTFFCLWKTGLATKLSRDTRFKLSENSTGYRMSQEKFVYGMRKMT